MEEECTMRPCATDFSIAAIMARHGRARCRPDPTPDTSLSPLGMNYHHFLFPCLILSWTITTCKSKYN